MFKQLGKAGNGECFGANMFFKISVPHQNYDQITRSKQSKKKKIEFIKIANDFILYGKIK